ncbi:ubiquitin family-domain-containing protein [Phlebopus sp. FC_14]|nr:ubiquitin family-domain-containing protein [Phlebopus sp. FC_14]
MADQAELVFVRNVVKTLASQPLTFNDDYQQPLQNTLKKVPVLSIEVPPVPERKDESSISVAAASIDITFKSLKPSQSFTLAVHSTDTISDIKSKLASQPRAPPADAQRLLLKGKALVDTKLLKEYNVKDGDIINLLVKPGFDWDPNTMSFPVSPSEAETKRPPQSGSPPKLAPVVRHSRTPSIVLSPSPSLVSLEPEGKPQDITLNLDTSAIPTASLSPTARSSCQNTISQPTFWEGLYSFLKSQFTNDDDASAVFEDFLLASKGNMTANEIAKIRDSVGVIGMAGR